MRIQNTTPFPIFVFESLDEKDTPIHVVVLKATYDITVKNGLRISDSQSEIVFSDIYRDKPLQSSVRIDTDLVPRKLFSDITFDCVAVSPNAKPALEWTVDVQVGLIRKSIQVCGPRFWEYGYVQGWKLSIPELTSSVPIHYELAFGGRTQSEAAPYPLNPVGMGFFLPTRALRDARIPGPQIWASGEPILSPDKHYCPAGLGPIAKHWVPRIHYCGTANSKWQQNRWPLRPVDFDFKYYNSAPTGLVYPGYLRGDELVKLNGLSKHGEQAFRLPGVFPLLIRLEEVRSPQTLTMNLDTLHCDTNLQRVYLTWRRMFPKSAGLPEINVSLHSFSANSAKVLLF